MKWGLLDFAVFSALVLVVASGFVLAIKKTNNGAYRSAAGVGLASAFILVWVNGAVGIIGDESNDANMMYLAVIAVGVIGALIARFEAPGMARAMIVTALAQAIVPLIVGVADIGSVAPNWPRDVLMVTAFFVALWLLSAWLFRNAAQAQGSAEATPVG